MFRRRAPSTGAAPQETFEAEALGLIDRLYATALRLTRNEADAEDIVQDTYLRAFRSAGQFDPGTNLRAWLFTILHNVYLNRRRDEGRNPVAADSDVVDRAANLPGREVDPEQQLLQQARAADVRQALDELPEAFREAVWLRDVEQFSYAEIARIVMVPMGTVMSRISRGRRLLHDKLAGRVGEGAGPMRLVGGETRRGGV